jgi:hypothetical protein
VFDEIAFLTKSNPLHPSQVFSTRADALLKKRARDGGESVLKLNKFSFQLNEGEIFAPQRRRNFADFHYNQQE